MTKHIADHLLRDRGAQHLDRAGMSEDVWPTLSRWLDPGIPDSPEHGTMQHPEPSIGRTGPHEHFTGVSLRSSRAQIGEDGFAHRSHQRKIGTGTGLGVEDADRFRPPVDILDLQTADFAGPQTISRQQLQDRLISEPDGRRVLARGFQDGGDLNQLPGVGIEGPDGKALARQWIDRAVSENAWLILYTHDVREAPSPWGCTPDTLSRLIAHAREAGCDIRTVGEVLAA